MLSSFRRHFFRRHRRISVLAALTLFAAFVLFLLVALSLPIIKPVYLLTLHAVVQPGQPPTNIATELRFGVWGVCATSVLNEPTLLANNGECFGPRLGYVIPADLIALIGISPSVVSALLKGLLVLLVLHPVSAGLSLLTLLPGLFLSSHAMSIVALIAAVVTALVSSVVFAADLALVLVARSKVRTLTQESFTIEWGNAVWMVLAATALTWIAVVLLSVRACLCCGIGRGDRDKEKGF